MPTLHVVVIGGSAGAIDALTKIASGLPEGFPAAVCIAVHHSGEIPSALPQILRRSGPLPAFHAATGERIAPGRIYVAPPGYHLVFSDAEARVIVGPRENGYRPSIDVLFRSAAQVYNAGTIGVVVSGTLDDGTAGLAAIKSQGGKAIVQEPGDATYSDMPRNAIAGAGADYILRAADIPAKLTELVGTPITKTREESPFTDDTETGADDLPRREPSPFVCPECGGTLFDVDDAKTPHYRCRVGHAYSPNTLAASQGKALEAALWLALRSMEEQRDLADRIARRSRAQRLVRAAERLEKRKDKIQQSIATIKNALEDAPWSTNGDDVDDNLDVS